METGKFLTFAVCTVMLWGIQSILSHSFNSGGKMNLIATVTKVLGFMMFIVITVFAFDAANFGNAKAFTDADGHAV
ncbi:hypothetical protein, partial [Anaerostipes hadrus]|nr:hypothetical protein [Anaerostipes hadrus]